VAAKGLRFEWSPGCESSPQAISSPPTNAKTHRPLPIRQTDSVQRPPIGDSPSGNRNMGERWGDGTGHWTRAGSQRNSTNANLREGRASKGTFLARSADASPGRPPTNTAAGDCGVTPGDADVDTRNALWGPFPVGHAVRPSSQSRLLNAAPTERVSRGAGRPRQR
jgi:hypothetical protein